MEIECVYYDDDTYGYTCDVQNQHILPDAKLEFIGEHKNGKNGNDVQFIVFDNCIISKIPQGLSEKFENLEGMEIWNSGLKDIKRSDLIQYKSFRCLFFGCNNIEYLSGDLFADCKKLEEISFSENPLLIVEPNIVDGLENLKSADLEGKKIKYGKIFSESIISFDDPKILEIKEKLYKEFMKNANNMLRGNYVKKMCRDNKELTEFKTFFQTDEALKDFCIKIGDKQFQVHKTFLAIRSKTFAEILRNNPQAENLNLVDISVDIFEHILKYLYTDEFPKKVDFKHLFAAAGRLKIEDLKEYAAEKILQQLDHKNAPEMLNLGSKYKHDGIKQKAFEEIKRKYSNIELKEEWLNKDEKIEKVVKHLKKIQKIEKDLEDSLVDDDD